MFWRLAGSPGVVLGIGAVVGLAAVGWVSVVALSIVLLDGMVAWLALAAAGLAGGWVFPLLGIRDARWAERLILGGALGIGALSLAILGLGALGVLTAAMLTSLLAVLGLAGGIRLYLDIRSVRGRSAGVLARERDRHLFAGKALRRGHISVPESATPGDTYHDRKKGTGSERDAFALLWLMIVPFVVLMLLACALPPGVLWIEEARGYDVLEYHLGVPKAFHEQGAITFLPENVYSNFPLNYEMLALAMMTLHGDAVEAAFMAQMANALLAGLFVASAWLAGSTWSPRAGVVAGVLAGTAPWLMYLSGIAYVETGMLAMGMASWVCLLRTTRGRGVSGAGRDARTTSDLCAERDGGRDWRWVLPAGFLAGLACGFKYTALPFVAMPGVVLLVAVKTNWKSAARNALLFGLGALITFSPWLIRNVVNTGNPVFPLAYGVFGAHEDVWSADLAQRWKDGHAPPAPSWSQEGAVTRLLYRMSETWTSSLGDFRIGWLLLAFGLIGAAMHRDRTTLALLVVLGLQCFIWYVFTHHYARFASVTMLPLVLLGGRIFRTPRAPLVAYVLAGGMVLGAGWNVFRTAELYGRDAAMQPGVDLYGRTQVFLNGYEPAATMNALGPESKILLVGEVRIFYMRPEVEYAVVFNRHPLEAMVGDLPEPPAPGEGLTPEQSAVVLDELQDRGITHIFVNWSEVRRLRRTYGFPAEINESLFAGLEAAGLGIVKRFLAGESEDPRAVLYEVPRHGAWPATGRVRRSTAHSAVAHGTGIWKIEKMSIDHEEEEHE